MSHRGEALHSGTRKATAQLMLWVCALLVSAVAPQSALAYDAEQRLMQKNSKAVPNQVKDVRIEDRLGATIPLDAEFIDEQGVSVSLRSLFAKGKPVVLSLVYFSCPSLCNHHLNGLLSAMRELEWSPGNQFEYLVVSFDPSEQPSLKPGLASEKKKNYLEVYNRPGTEAGWHFWTGSEESIKALTESVGFYYKWDEPTQEWAHGSAAIVITPEGKVSEYLHGIIFDQKRLRLSLAEAGNGKIGKVFEQFLLLCAMVDPTRSDAIFYSLNAMKMAGGFTVLLVGFWIIPNLIGRRRKETES